MRRIPSWALLAVVMAPLGGAFAASEPSAADILARTARLLSVPVSGLVISPQAQDIENPYAGDKNALVKGEQLFHTMNCVGCHAPEGGGGMGPPLSDPHWVYGGSPAELYLSIMQGRPNGMPAWGGALPPQAIWSLVTYIKTLQEPESAEKQPSQSQTHPPPEAKSGNP